MADETKNQDQEKVEKEEVDEGVGFTFVVYKKKPPKFEFIGNPSPAELCLLNEATKRMFDDILASIMPTRTELLATDMYSLLTAVTRSFVSEEMEGEQIDEDKVN